MKREKNRIEKGKTIEAAEIGFGFLMLLQLTVVIIPFPFPAVFSHNI